MALPLLLDALERLPEFERVARMLPSLGDQLRVSGLTGSSDATMVAALGRRAS